MNSAISQSKVSGLPNSNSFLITNLSTFVFSFLLMSGCNADPLGGGLDFPLSNGYKIYQTSGHSIQLINTASSKWPEIPAKIVAVGWNSRVICAKQQLLKPRSDSPTDEYLVPDPGKFKFWIIDLATTNRIGPLDVTGFRRQLSNLNQEAIVLKDVTTLGKSAR